MKFDYVITHKDDNSTHIIALCKSDGKTIRGVAKWASGHDEYNEDVGKDLAESRCLVKLKKRQADRAAKEYEKAFEAFEKAKTELYKRAEISWRSFEEYDDAVADNKRMEKYVR